MRRIWLGLLACGLLALPAVAQEKEAEAEQPVPDQRPQIRVLRHPHDLASFYRSAGGNGSGFSYGYSDSYGLYGSGYDESGLPPLAHRPDLRGRIFGPRWDSGFYGDYRTGTDGFGTRRRFAPRRNTEPVPTPSPGRP